MIVCGIHKDPWHNSGAAVIRDVGEGPRVITVSEERFDRVKDSRAFPDQAIAACLREVGAESIRAVDLWVLDHIRSEDWRSDHFRQACRRDSLLEQVDPAKILVVNHHLAHACSTFFASPFERAAILIVDGRGSDNETQSLFVGGPDGIQLLERSHEIGVGLLYASVTQAIGFGLLQEGKTMGLAPYGEHVRERFLDFPQRYEGIATDYSHVCVDGSYELKVPYSPLSTFERQARAAYEVQQECESALLHLAAHARKRTGLAHLCISGGVGLNSVANYRILRAGLFDDIFINPACSDTGIPLGAALYGYHVVYGRARVRGPMSPYLGPTYEPGEFVSAADVAVEGGCRRADGDTVLDVVADLLASNKIVAVCHGRSETGPRALGNRSILMSPLQAENKDILNARVKHREAFRPFAPAVLEELAQQYFEIDRPSPYMLLVPFVRPEMRSVIPAVTHVDGTGRLQTLAKDADTVMRRLVELFYARTGVPVLLNTSFNVNKEPIVESPMDAVRCFLSTNIDALLLNDVLVIK